MNKFNVYALQILFVCSIAAGSQNINFEDKSKWLNVVRYLIYLLTIKSIPHLCNLIQGYLRTQSLDLRKAIEARDYLACYTAALALLVYSEESLFRPDFVYIGAAYLIITYPKMCSRQPISYGVGMACSFFEGYLVHIIPSDGANFVGFEENIRALEQREGVLFPVKKLFIIITKNLYCPPDLKDFNKGTDVPYLDSFNSPEDVKKSVAGVKNRIYRNSAYKVCRPPPRPAAPTAPTAPTAPGSPPPPGVPLAAECATPLHTLHRVLERRALYKELADINVEQVVDDFCRTLRSIIDNSPECRGKCELIFYDNSDPEQNLAQILLDRVSELVPDYEERIRARSEDNVVED